MRIAPQTGFSVLLGSRDWDHDAWVPEFYPDALPSDWRLTFYTNHFATVLVPETRWLAASDASLDQWIADTDDAFVFAFEVSVAALLARNTTARLRRLGDRLGLLLLQGPATSRALWTQAVRASQAWPVAVPDGDAWAAAPGALTCWRPVLGSHPPAVRPSAVLLVDPPASLITDVVRRVLGWTSEVPLPVFVQGSLAAVQQTEAAFHLLPLPSAD